MIIELGDRAYNTGTLDDDVLWRINTWEGWGAPTARLSEASATSQHGTFPTEQMWGNRSLILRGLATGISEAAMDGAWDALCAEAGDLITVRPLNVLTTVPKTIGVVSGGDPNPIMQGGYTFGFSIPLKAHEPFKRALAPSTVRIRPGETLTVSTAGNRAATPRVSVLAEGTLIVQHLGSNQRLTSGLSAVPVGAVADFGNHTLYSATGQNLYALLDHPLWPELAPGGNQLANQGTADLLITYYDTWT